MEWPWKTNATKLLPGQDLRPLATLFPLVEASDVHAALDQLPLDTSRKLGTGQVLRPVEYFSEEVRLLTWRGTSLAVPYRVYMQEPAPGQLLGLTNRQRQVVHCLYLRHYDGYLRQRHLEVLFALGNGAPEDYTVPFTFSLVGEYVQEILEVLVANLTPALLASYVALINENPLYWQKTQGRVASYWDIEAPGSTTFSALYGCPAAGPFAKGPATGGYNSLRWQVHFLYS
jgi:hypothetical protein